MRLTTQRFYSAAENKNASCYIFDRREKNRSVVSLIGKHCFIFSVEIKLPPKNAMSALNKYVFYLQ